MDLPPAPTPPVSGSIGPNVDRPSNLLSLLKFSTTSHVSSHQNQPQQSQQSQQREHTKEGQERVPEDDDDDDDDDDEEEEVDEEDEKGEDNNDGDRYRHHQPQQSARQPAMQAPNQSSTRIHQPAPTAADPSGLLAALIRGAHDLDEPKSIASVEPKSLVSLPSAQPTNPFARSGSPSSDTRSYLLNLLNRPKPSQTDQPLLAESSRSREVTPQSPEHPVEANRYLVPHHQPQPPSSHLSHQPYQQDAFADIQRPPNANQFSYSQAQSVQEPADMSVIYQKLMGSLNQTSPHIGSIANASNNDSGGGSSGSNRNTNINRGSSGHGSTHGSAAPSYHLLAKDQSSPVGPLEHSRLSKDHSPLTSPPGQRLSTDRAPSLHSHPSHHSAHPSAKQTPPISDFSGFVAIDTASEAVHDAASRADRAVHEVMERATHEPAAEYADSTLRPEDSEWIKASAASSDAAHSLEKQMMDEEKSDLEKHQQTYGSFDESSPYHSQETFQDSMDVIHGIADNWESAEQDEVVVLEEKEVPSVRVFNFPMKPWISISLNEDATEPRPQFKDESIMDIARLKKEFDQVDRNLYTASQTYMTYGMSKQGGLRVIRQDDGKDAKVFTDTKDRVFNVAMSVTPPDYEGVHREAIIGTGISGTVYWVHIKDGEKDHIEDHLEQYGFALPPINSPDGDVPGGALKTRAKASTMHPEFFAVGRGKSINIIWPSYILQNKKFKPGHDRVVDTEALFDECSLKINTGKAGKDFTFSQDDSVVVSLDKSGRVKFWDVRDLTAAKEGSEALPLPAHSSLEVKEPLMTLASTPEGEKAWPTSVLLLDKQRPYQKRCALRYMIVGMKQNHTLQLWDLALGKPVQEFNLPHSKESDAVCSVMYHPASGMIIIGHPTRNSVYFAHLSAPKYSLKSVSQAEYLQRLVAQDPSIPQPDSTAVISGVREYSFANRGILRSLDILSNPAMNHDSDDATLFELYAMHSKGVACLLIRQAELGWSKENKVLEAVDAVSEGVVTVAKLKTPQQMEISRPSSVPEVAPVRIVQRASVRDLGPQNTSAVSEETARGAEAVAPVKYKSETKEAETPGPSSSKESQMEKPERKSRRRKNKDGEVVATTAAAAVNGTPPKAEISKILNGTHGYSTSVIAPEALDSALHDLEARLGAAMAESLETSLNKLHGSLDESARVRDEGFNQHQLKLLDMVSEVLNDNTQKVLETLIHQQFTEVVIPSISDKTGQAVSEMVQHKLQPSIGASVQKEIQNSLPHALNHSLRSKDFVSAVSDRVTKAVSTSVQQEVVGALSQRLGQTLTTIVTQSSQHVVNELHQRYHEQFEQVKAQNAADALKIEQLLSYVSRLTDMVSTMAASQSSLQAEFIKLKQQQPAEVAVQSHVRHPHNAHLQPQPQSQYRLQPEHHPYSGSLGHSTGTASLGYDNNMTSPRGSYPPSQAPSLTKPYVNSPHQYLRGSQHVSASSPHGSMAASEQVAPVTNVSALAGAYAHHMSKTEAEADHDLVQRIRVIEGAIQEGRLQDAMIQWIQSGREEEIFRRSLSRYPASKFEDLPPLMLLVVIATISKDLKPNSRLKEEVEWIEMAVRAFGANVPNYGWDSEVSREVTKSTSATMQLLINRVQPLIAGIQDGFPTDPFLANVDRDKLEWIVQTSRHILESVTRALR